MNNLYNISNQYRLLENALTESEGDLSPELEKLLTINEEDREEAFKNLFYMKLEKEDEIEGLTARVTMINELIAKKQRTVDSCKKTIIKGLETFGEQKVDEFTLKLKKSTATNTEQLEAFIKCALKYVTDETDLEDVLYLFPDEITEENCIMVAAQETTAKEIQDALKITREQFKAFADAVLCDYVKEKVVTSYAPDKKLIKESINNGKVIAGAHLQTNLNLAVK